MFYCFVIKFFLSNFCFRNIKFNMKTIDKKQPGPEDEDDVDGSDGSHRS